MPFRIMNTSPSHRIRRLGAPDAPALGAFFVRNDRSEINDFFRPFPLTRDTAERLLSSDSKDCFIGLEVRGEFIGLSMCRGMEEGYAIPSFGIMIDYQHHGKGWGRKLTEWTLRWVDEAGFAKVRLTVFAVNRRAICLYESLGFKESARERLVSGEERLIMFRESPLRALQLAAQSDASNKSKGDGAAS